MERIKVSGGRSITDVRDAVSANDYANVMEVGEGSGSTELRPSFRHQT
jgi:hypothetical protein